MIEKYNIQNSVVIQSFNDSVLEKIYKLNPNIRLEKLLLMRVFPFVILDGSGEFSRFNQKKYSYISSFNIWHQGYTKRFEKKVKRWGKEVKVWCINNPENLSPQFNPDGVITDRPDLWIK